MAAENRSVTVERYGAGYRSGDVRIHPHSEQRVLQPAGKMR